MLKYTHRGSSISFSDQSIIINHNETTRKASIRYGVYDQPGGQFFIYTDDFFVICKYNYRRGEPLQIFDKYTFFSLPDDSKYILAYFLLNDIPIYKENDLMNKLDLFGFSLTIDNIDTNSTPTIGN